MNKLREIRKKKKMTQQELEKISGIPQSQISHFEIDRQMREEDIKAIAKALKVTADKLIGTKE